MTPVAEAFSLQVDWCRRLLSPFTAALLEWALRDLAAKGPVFDILGLWSGNPVKDALALRWTGAMHALVLNGMAPTLDEFYPGGPRHGPNLTPAFADALKAVNRDKADWIRRFITSPPQTNEVGRSAVLIGGFLEIARRTGLALRPLEIGASAGLNMNWDAYRYRLGEADWGDPASKVQFAPRWSGKAPPVEAPLNVARRGACDIEPVDLSDPAARLRLRAYVWPDQEARLAALDAAIERALAVGARVEKADAADWVENALAELRSGEAAVLYHSIMWSYMPPPTIERIVAATEDAGRRAKDAAPFFWLRFEMFSKGSDPELRLTSWPGGRTDILARAHPHGAHIDWLGT